MPKSKEGGRVREGFLRADKNGEFVPFWYILYKNADRIKHFPTKLKTYCLLRNWFKINI